MQNEILFFPLNQSTMWNDDNLIGGINFKANFNSSNEPFSFGQVICNELKFTVMMNIDNPDPQMQQDYWNYNNIGETILWRLKPLNSNSTYIMGRFIIEKVQKKNKNAYEYTCYSQMRQAERIADSFLKGLTFPMPLNQFAPAVIKSAFPGYTDNSFTIDYNGNENFIVKNNFEGINIPYRQLISYIAQICSGNAINPLGSYRTPFKIAKPSNYQSHLYHQGNCFTHKLNSAYKNKTKQVGQVIIKHNANDIGVAFPASLENPELDVYTIVNNPLLYAEKPEEIVGVAESIYNAIKDIYYYRGEITTPILQGTNIGINPGDFFSVRQELDKGNGQIKYVDVPMLLSEYVIDKSGIKLKSNGPISRNNVGTRNPEIIALRGKTNELTRDIEKTESKLTDKYNNLSTSFQQTAKSLKLTASNETGKSTLTLTGDGITASSAEILFNGVVKFADLNNEGSTQINGANITSGKVKAEFIEAGAIKATTLYGSDGKKKAIESTGTSLNIGGDANFYDYSQINLYTQTVHIKPYNDSYFALIISNWNPTYAIYSNNEAFTIGTSNHKFGDGYFTQLHIGGYKLSQNAGKLQFNGKDVATSTNKFTDGIYLDNSTNKLTVSGTTLKFGSKEIAYVDSGGGGSSISKLENNIYTVSLDSSGNFIPNRDNTMIFGSRSYVWKEIFTKKISFDSSNYIEVSAGDLKFKTKKVLCEGDSFGVKKLVDSIYELTISSKTVYPNYTGFSLGTTSNYWQNIYTQYIWFYTGYSGFKKMSVDSNGQVVISTR